MTSPPDWARAGATAIVATRVGGNAELIEAGMSGSLVPPQNSGALAGAMVSYLLERATARRHAGVARRVAEERFSLARMVADYGALYQTALAGAAQAAGARTLAPR